MAHDITKYDTGERAVFSTRESTATPQTRIAADGNLRRRGKIRFTAEQIYLIRKQRAEGMPTTDLMAHFGVSRDAIDDIVNRRTYAWVAV